MLQASGLAGSRRGLALTRTTQWKIAISDSSRAISARHPAPTASFPRNPKSWVPLVRRKKRGTLLGLGHRNLLEALQEVDARPPLVAVLRARPARRLLIENSVRVLLRKSDGHRSEIACRINRTMTGTRSPPPLSPTARPPAPRAPHLELLPRPELPQGEQPCPSDAGRRPAGLRC